MKAKHLLSTLLLTLMAATAVAEDVTPRLVVWQKNGEKVYYELEQQPETTFDNGLLTIRTNTVSTTYQLSNVLRYTYEGVVDGVEEVSQPGVVIAQKDNSLYVSNLKAGTPVRLYTTGGVLLQTLTANGKEAVVVSVEAQPAGVYIVKAGDQSIKITRR